MRAYLIVETLGQGPLQIMTKTNRSCFKIDAQ
jgi:hypothetical protein